MNCIDGIVLAGGQSSRFGAQDKAWAFDRGEPLIQRVVSTLAPQVRSVAISANRNLSKYQCFGYPVLPDRVLSPQGTALGPLHGVYTGLCWTRQSWLACAPCDMPDLPPDWVQRLHHALAATTNTAAVAYAHDGRRGHYLCCLLATDKRAELRAYLERGQCAVWRCWQAWNAVAVDFSDCADCFRNINTPQALDTNDNTVSFKQPCLPIRNLINTNR